MYNAISHLLDYGIIYIYKTKLKKNLCDLLYLMYVYIYKGKPSDMSPFISPTNMGWIWFPQLF